MSPSRDVIPPKGIDNAGIKLYLVT